VAPPDTPLDYDLIKKALAPPPPPTMKPAVRDDTITFIFNLYIQILVFELPKLTKRDRVEKIYIPLPPML